MKIFLPTRQLILLLCGWLCLSYGTAYGQGSTVVKDRKSADRLLDLTQRQSSFYFFFRVGSSTFDPKFRDNALLLNRTLAYLDVMLKDNGAVVDSVVFVTSASPEGSKEVNERLASSRAQTIRSLILKAQPSLADKVRIHSKREDWAGLYESILLDDNVPNQEQAADIVSQSSSLESRKYFLRQLDNGTSWNYISKHILPELRTVTTTVHYTSQSAEPVFFREYIRDTLMFRDTLTFRDTLRLRDTVFYGTPVQTPARRKSIELSDNHPLWALKSNALYWALLQPNIEAEFYFANRWSLNFEYQVAWWKNEAKHQFYQYMYFGPEGRYWFKNDGSFTGHMIGLHVGFGLYDFSLGQERNNYMGYQGEFAIALGMSYSYVWRIHKQLILEVGLGFGYIMTEYRRYDYRDTHYVYQATERMQFVGPTKARVTFGWQFGNKNNTKKRKGGNR